MLYKNSPRRKYQLQDGTLVPGVTTVVGVLYKPALIKWAWEGGYNCGFSQVPRDFDLWSNSSKDSTAGVGTIVHYKIQCFLNGEKEEYGSGWEQEHIDMAQVPFERFCKYYESIGGKPILTEYSCVHEKLRYGGTLDLLTDSNDGPVLTEIKTSKAIYEEYYIQLEGYYMLLAQENKWRALRPKRRVLLVPKDGRLEAPDVPEGYTAKARATWTHLIKMYHRLNEFRKAA